MQANCTSLTLIPTVSNPSFPSDFRPIACYSVLYKIITKVLATRLQKVVGTTVNKAQLCFILGRVISDNVLLATELVKG